MAKKKPENAPAFEQIVARLEEIAEQLGSGDAKLEQAVALFEEGVQLAKQGNRQLDAAEKRIEQLLEDDNVAELEPAGQETSPSREES